MSFSTGSVQQWSAAALFILTSGLAYLLLGVSPSGPRAGENVSPIPGNRIVVQTGIWRQHDRTLILAIRRGCHFCEASMPFYRKLSQLAGEHAFGTPIVVESPDDPATMRFLMRSQGLQFASFPSIPLQALQAEGTPTAVLVDQQGTVLRSWNGELSRGQEADLMRALERP